MTTSATTTATNNTSLEMTAAKFTKTYGKGAAGIAAYNIETKDTDFDTIDECLAHINLGEIFGNEQPQARIETVDTAQIIESENKPVTTTETSKDADKKDVPTATSEETKFADIDAQHKAGTLAGVKATAMLCEFLGVSKDAGTEMALCNDAEKAVRQRVKKLAIQYGFAKNEGAASNQLMSYLGKTYKSGEGTTTTTTTTTKSKFTQPILPVFDAIKFASLMATGSHMEYMAQFTADTAQYNAEMVTYGENLATEKAEAQKAQAAKLDSKVKSLCDDLVKIFGNVETAQSEAFSLITNYFLALQNATAQAEVPAAE